MGSLGVRVLPSGYCSLYHTRRGVLCTFCPNSQHAIINGNEIHITLKTGAVAIYQINSSGTGVTGPIRVFH